MEVDYSTSTLHQPNKTPFLDGIAPRLPQPEPGRRFPATPTPPPITVLLAGGFGW